MIEKFSVEQLSRVDEIFEREAELSSFCEQTAITVFSTWGWISTWLKLYRNLDCKVILVRDSSGRLVGLAPLYQSRIFMAGMPVRCLRMIGDYESAAEYLMPFVDSDCASGVLETLGQYLVERSADWDCMWLPAQAAWTPGFKQWHHALQLAGLIDKTRPATFSAVEIPSSLASLKQQQSKSNRSTIRKVRNRYEARYLLRPVTSPDEIPHAYEELKRLHELRWQAVGIQGAFSRRPKFEQFIDQMLPKALSQGWLRLDMLELDGEIGAVQLGFVFGDVYNLIQEGFHPDIDGIGNLLRSLVLDQCCEQGLTRYDFLGGYSEHKRRWGAVERPGCDLLVLSKGYRARILDMVNLWPTGRFSRLANLH